MKRDFVDELRFMADEQIPVHDILSEQSTELIKNCYFIFFFLVTACEFSNHRKILRRYKAARISETQLLMTECGHKGLSRRISIVSSTHRYEKCQSITAPHCLNIPPPCNGADETLHRTPNKWAYFKLSHSASTPKKKKLVTFTESKRYYLTFSLDV